MINLHSSKHSTQHQEAILKKIKTKFSPPLISSQKARVHCVSPPSDGRNRLADRRRPLRDRIFRRWRRRLPFPGPPPRNCPLGDRWPILQDPPIPEKIKKLSFFSFELVKVAWETIHINVRGENNSNIWFTRFSPEKLHQEWGKYKKEKQSYFDIRTMIYISLGYRYLFYK